MNQYETKSSFTDLHRPKIGCKKIEWDVEPQLKLGMTEKFDRDVICSAKQYKDYMES